MIALCILAMLTGTLAAPDLTVNITLLDPERDNRLVKAKVCMPEGDGPFPLYLFSHGFDCDPRDYDYFCQVAATVMIYGNITNLVYDTNASNLALDATFLAKVLPQQSQDNKTSPIFGKLGGPVVLGGHSMGGGVSILAAGDHAPVDGLALFAPGLYTQPEANPFLKDVTFPALYVSGGRDCGPNALDSQTYAAFNGTASDYKFLVVLNGASHCGWTIPHESDTDLGVCKNAVECNTIPHDTQQAFGNQLVQGFIASLRGKWDTFETLLASGEANGTWTYISSKTSDPKKVLHNDCPCPSHLVI